MKIDTDKSFVIADIPGLIEGASEGVGLGHKFLKHLSRTKVLLHLIDGAPIDEDIDPVNQAKLIVEELKKYDVELYEKPRWIVLNKLDLNFDYEKLISRIRNELKWNNKIFVISAVTGAGCKELINNISQFFETDDNG